MMLDIGKLCMLCPNKHDGDWILTTYKMAQVSQQLLVQHPVYTRNQALPQLLIPTKINNALRN